MSEPNDRIDQLIEGRQDDLGARVLEHEGVRQIVDIFRGATEVKELGVRLQERILCELREKKTTKVEYVTQRVWI